jgi:Rad3-related DNA helicase
MPSSTVQECGVQALANAQEASTHHSAPSWCTTCQGQPLQAPTQLAGAARQVHDIEDLVRIGRANKACPYFMARQLSGNAQLVFCPYTYLLDPLVRAAMEVDVEGAVLIFDEAHNIEDVARWGGRAGVSGSRGPRRAQG